MPTIAICPQCDEVAAGPHVEGCPLDTTQFQPTDPTKVKLTSAAKSVDTSDYFKSHWHQPRGYGLWIFTDANGDQRSHTGFYGEARRTLPAGTWKVLP